MIAGSAVERVAFDKGGLKEPVALECQQTQECVGRTDISKLSMESLSAGR